MYSLLFIFQMNDQKVTSNMYFSATEESESCFAQPKPCTRGRESTIYGKGQKESLPPLEKLKISAVSTANGVKSLHEQPLANDAAGPPGSMEETQPLERPKESGPPLPGGRNDTPGAEEKKEDMEAALEARPSEGTAETETLETEAKHQPSRTVGERDCPGVVGGTENPQTAREMKPQGIAETTPSLEAGREPQPQEEIGKDTQPQLLETVSKEPESLEILEGSQLVETAEERQFQETLGRGEQSQLLETISQENGSPEISERSQFLETVEEQHLQETIPKENGSPETSEGSQLVEAAEKNDLIHKTSEGLGNMGQIQPEGIVRIMKHPAGILETGTNEEMVRKIHTNKEGQNIEGKSMSLKIQGAQMCSIDNLWG